MTAAIRVQSVGKRYHVRQEGRRAYRTFRESLVDAAKVPFRKLSRGRAEPKSDAYWALTGVDFEVQPGEVVGIIGRNGAGKSTLLKILSRITRPTTGRVELNGRVGSLLEVGTGFHPELTGRENIYLNGSILGMSRREIARRFDEIVEFAEVDRFLDTPVKRYSSGMYVRLAFAVAAHLEPEILLVDEVLAVGDLGFQKKCMGKMSEVANHGRTIFFVSHSMQAISALTDRCLIFKEGRVHLDAPTHQAVQEFIEMSTAGTRLGEEYRAVGDLREKNCIASARVVSSATGGVHDWGAPLTFEFDLSVDRPIDSLCFSFQVVNNLGQPVCHFWQLGADLPFRKESGLYTLSCHVDKLRLYMGHYTVTTWLTDRRAGTILESLTGICPFEVSMQGQVREEYEWAPGACQYLEDNRWNIERVRAH